MKKSNGNGNGAWQRVVAANRTFTSGDLNLVGHPDTPMISPLDVPYKNGAYSLTNVEIYNHATYAARLGSGNFALLIACMDRSFARPAWDFVRGKIGRHTQLVSLFNAGGAAQPNQRRLQDLGVLAHYLMGLGGTFKSLWLMGHTHNCGGLGAFACNGVKVCQHLKVDPNTAQEFAFVRGYVFNAAPILVPPGFAGKVRYYAMADRDNPRAVQLK